MPEEVNHNFAEMPVNNTIKSPWDEDESPKNKSLVGRDDEDSDGDNMNAIAKGLAVGILWSMSGLLDDKE